MDTGLLSDTDSDCPFVDTGLLSVSDCPFVDTGLLSDSQWLALCGHRSTIRHRQWLPLCGHRSTIRHRQWLPLCGHRSTIRHSDCPFVDTGLLLDTDMWTQVYYQTQIMTAPLWTQVYCQTDNDCPFVDSPLSDTDSDCPFVDTGLLSDTDNDCPFVDRPTIRHRQWLPLCGHRSTIRQSVTAPLWTQVYYQTVSDCPFVDTGLSVTDSDCRGLLLHTGRLTQRSAITHRQMDSSPSSLWA